MSRQKILLGISGGIAAYKTPELIRQLKAQDADVQVVITRSARQFVTPTTLQAVSGHPVRDNLWDSDAGAAMGHIELARWADLVLIAPATAEIIARLASGAAPDLLMTVCLATEAPVVIAPAMNRVMWEHPAVVANCRILAERGVRILGPASGNQACGEVGPGRMLEPADIAAAISTPTAAPATGDQPLRGMTVMVTAGPTREAIDPVRYISNRSSGKMGYALAVAARNAGAKVRLVSGPVSLPAPDNIKVIAVESAKEMFGAVHEHLDGVDIFIGAAAIADYRAASVSKDKIKKSGEEMSVALVRSPDILASVARLNDRPFTVGFAAETSNLREHALNKLEQKNINMIVANLVGAERGFDTDDNTVDVFWKGEEKSFPRMDKAKLAAELVTLIAARYQDHIGADTLKELPALRRDL
jgi:phosphopantothenoylcysteine decarboxylase/phosphopantothenate--cysteine ligase